mmetsp:Transcript_114509/g.287723  ORF Transcript_114509/g.287723 Transcript_114509/m.287723 type:complete len:127 (+) Transcript_114509:115-495(+)
MAPPAQADVGVLQEDPRGVDGTLWAVLHDARKQLERFTPDFLASVVEEPRCRCGGVCVRRGDNEGLRAESAVADHGTRLAGNVLAQRGGPARASARASGPHHGAGSEQSRHDCASLWHPCARCPGP